MARSPSPRLALYRVRDADIWCKAGRANIGDVVELDSTEANYFNNLGMLAPYIPDDDVEEEEIGGFDDATEG